MPDAAGRSISLAALTVLEISPVEAVRIAASCGYSHIGLRPIAATPGERHFPIMTDALLRRALKAALRDHGVAVLDAEIIRLQPEMDWDVIAAALEFSQEFGAKFLLIADNDSDPARSRDALAQLAALADPYGVTPHLESMPWTCSPNLAAARQRIAEIKNCALLVDAFHLARSGGSPADIATGDPAVGYLQLCDIAGPIPSMDEILREARSDRLFPGEGEIDLVALLQKLPDIPISLEVPADRLRDAGWDAAMRARRAIEACKAVLEAAGEPA